MPGLSRTGLSIFRSVTTSAPRGDDTIATKEDAGQVVIGLEGLLRSLGAVCNHSPVPNPRNEFGRNTIETAVGKTQQALENESLQEAESPALKF